MTLFLRLFAPAALLGAALLLGERPANPPDELPGLALTAVSDELCGRALPCPDVVPGRPDIALLAVRLPPAAAEGLKADAPPPETRALSPPSAA